jgi:aryl-alcohol dehydrogenase-like predicted oxidoreductase
MIERELGRSGIKASVIGLGSWAIGGWMWGGQEKRESIRAIQVALDHGVTLVDTAPIYGYGLSEEVVGEAIKGRRQEIVLATKCGLSWQGEEPRWGEYHFSANDKGLTSRESAKYHVYRDLKPASIRREVEESLRRLNVEAIDLYQTHWQDRSTPIEDSMATLMDLKQKGKIRAIGVSNAKVWQIREYRKAGTLDTAQEKYSMLDRGLEAELLPYCRKRAIGVLAYSPLAMGLLTGKIGSERAFGEGDLRARLPRFSPENRLKVCSLLDQLVPVARQRGATLAQLVIAWTMAQPGITHVLCGMRDDSQARSNAAAGEVILSAEEIELIERILNTHATGIV